ITRTNVGSPTGREPYGDAGPVVVVGVTPHQGGRESRPHGPRGPGDRTLKTTRRYAKCRTPKRCWVSSVNAEGVACRVTNCTDNCSTRTCICWPTRVCTPTTEP